MIISFRNALVALLLSAVVGCGSSSTNSTNNAGEDNPPANQTPGDETNKGNPDTGSIDNDAGNGTDDGSSDNNDDTADKPGIDDSLVYVPMACRDEDGNAISGLVPGAVNRQQTLVSESGRTISFEIFEPTSIDCDNIAKGAHPLVLQGHGFGGSRNSSTDAFTNYRDQGYAVISIDQRGFGDSTGTVTVMDPNLEGKDLIAILDYAEQELDFLAWRDETNNQFVSRPEQAISQANGVNLVVGSIGSSYGGGFQTLLHNVDDKERLDAMVPDITWHDLRYSLNQDDTVKSAWDLLLVSIGEAGALGPSISPDVVFSPEVVDNNPTNRGLEPFIRETLIKGLAENVFPRDALDYFNYHSPSYWCGLNNESMRPYELATSAVLEPRIFNLDDTSRQVISDRNGVDVLFTQGMRDTLFNFNEAWWNWQCMTKRSGGLHDVGLITHQTGHILPGLQPAAGEFACSGLTIADATMAFFNEKLRQQPMDESLALTKDHICMSLADQDAVYIAFDDFLAPRAEGVFNREPSVAYTKKEFTISDYQLPRSEFTFPSMEQTFGNIVGNFSRIAPQAAELITELAEESILAGIPVLNLTITATSESACAPSTGCNSQLFVGLGHRSNPNDEYQLIDEQLTPVRGIGDKMNIEMVGIAERLKSGDQLALLVFAAHEQFFSSASRDLITPTISIKGEVLLPLYSAESSAIIPALSN